MLSFKPSDKGHFVVTRGQHGGFFRLPLTAAICASPHVRFRPAFHSGAIAPLLPYFATACRRVQTADRLSSPGCCYGHVPPPRSQRRNTGDTTRITVESGVSGIQISATISRTSISRKRQYPHTQGRLLFRGHYFSVLLSSLRIVRKLQAIWFNVALKMSRCSGAIFSSTTASDTSQSPG